MTATDMEPESAVELSILVATRNRASFLSALFESLQAALAAVPATVEMIIIDNGSTDDTGRIIDEWGGRLPRLIHLVEPHPGKSRALNQGLRQARAPLLVFVDDDVQVSPSYLAEVLRFFADHPHYDAAGGRVRLPPEVTDPELLARVAMYRSLPLYDGGDAVCDGKGLAGCNMALRRRVFDIIGPFNERLGPGASGAHEDADLVGRIRSAKLRIGYMPGAIAYHAVDPARFTPAAFRDFHQRMAGSLYALDPAHAWRKSAGRLPGILIGLAWWSLVRDPTRRARAWGRMIQHAEVLRLRWRDGWTPPAPVVDWQRPDRRGS
jgi:glycosyltransferase involved in cell wall biosynthesis